MKGNKLNAADYITIYRIAAAPVLVIVMMAGLKHAFAWLLLLSLASDLADGIVSRKLNIATKHGAQLDSIGDVLTFIIAVIGAWKFGQDFFKENYRLVLLAVVPYVLQLVIAIIRYGRPSSFHTYLAKAAAVLQGLFLLSLLFFHPVMWLFYPAVFVTVIEIAEEIILVLLLKEWKTDVKGLYWVLKGKGP